MFKRFFGGKREAAPDTAAFSVTPKIKADWERDGFLVLKGFYRDQDIARADDALRAAWQNLAPRVVVDDLNTGVRLPLSEVSAADRSAHRFKVNDLYLEDDHVRGLALNERITPILSELLGHTPVVCNSLNFEQGSGQPDHVDALYMTPRSPHHLVAIWVAMEDCHPNAGPLRYYPGSHKIEQYVFSTGSHHFVPDEMPMWAQYMEDQVRQRGLSPLTFAAEKGDVFIWSAYLLHGGSDIKDHALTRKSVVFHYYSEHDCAEMGATLVPFGGGYWMHRRHQPVPGRGESEAPPLPSAA